jgi:ubiquinone/menaquinone biosynthesis C-methylase UbiE
MEEHKYFMESDEEALRLDMKTDGEIVQRQAQWAGIAPGMRVADLGCGSGKTTFFLNHLVQPAGETIGVDFSEQRIDYAQTHYQGRGLSFHRRDIKGSLDDLGTFDFIWVRFVLEYYRVESFDIVKNITRILKPGGTLCLVDLDYNSLSYFGLSPRLEQTIAAVIGTIEKELNFDPYVGKKLYAYAYDLGLQDLRVDLQPHNLIYGQAREQDVFNWTKKMALAGAVSDDHFDAYRGGREAFLEELNIFINDPRRFIYTPLFICRGIKPEG